jgi:glycosyltransferase involved in cell wall biosynthesis
MTADAVGGVWQYALDLAEGLRLHGVEGVVAGLGPPPNPEQRKAAERAGVVLRWTDLPLDWTAGTAKDVEEAGWAMARMAVEAEADIVHLSSPALAASAHFPAPVVAVAHSCVATWWQSVRTGPLPQEFQWRTELVRRGYHAADSVLAPTAAFANATAEIYRLPRQPTVVRNGRRAAAARDVRTAEPFAFTAGRLWDEGKNLAAIDRAARRIAIPVLAAGPLAGPNGARLTFPNLRVLGQLSDDRISDYLSARPIYVSTARYEPFGLAVLEAAQAGCPLVLADIPTFRELWDGAAVFVSGDDDHAVARAIEQLSDDERARDRWGQAARDRSRAYSVEAMCLGVLAVYRALAGEETAATSIEEAAA